MAHKILGAADDEVITLQFDTTSRAAIEGEWIAFLVRFSSESRLYRLRPLFMAFEDRQNIISLFIEQLKRLALAASTTVQALWNKISAIMTDSVSKNLQIAAGIAEVIHSPHVPHQILCVVHTCENMDLKCLEVLQDIESRMGLKTKILEKMPGLAAFMRFKRSIVELAIEAITKLVLNTGHKTSLHREFLDICNEGKISRDIVRYIPRRFAKLGYCAGTVVHHLPELRQLLSKFSSNQHSQACKLYLSFPFILDAMVALAKMTEFVVLPFLDMVQNSDNIFLLQILPQLYLDLKNNSLETLKNFQTAFKLKYPEETSNQTMLIRSMANAIADGLRLQRGREFGIPDSGAPRATDLSKLPPEILRHLPTHNIDCERELAIFDRKVENMCGGYNQTSSYKGIRDEMMLHAADLSVPQRHQVRIFKELDIAEENWTTQQKEKSKAKRKLKEQEGIKQELRWKDLLTLCKKWGGPCESLEAIDIAENLVSTEAEKKKLFKTEIVFNKLSNFHPALNYGVNLKSNQELKKTLQAIVVFEEKPSATDATLTV